jgi:hypothetical protein
MTDPTTNVPETVTLELSLAEVAELATALDFAVSFGAMRLVPLQHRLYDKANALTEAFGYEAMQAAVEHQHPALKAEAERLIEEGAARVEAEEGAAVAQTDGI